MSANKSNPKTYVEMHVEQLKKEGLYEEYIRRFVPKAADILKLIKPKKKKPECT